MTTTRIQKIGYCAHDSKEGDWAFEIALDLARRLDLPLNVFGFLLDPYQRDKHEKTAPKPADPQELVRLEKELRFRYDKAAGDYVEVGFRLCHDGAWYELHRCLCRREFQVLVLAKPAEDALFLGNPMDQFIESFICPTIVVGPGGKDRIHCNQALKLIQNQIALPLVRPNSETEIASTPRWV